MREAIGITDFLAKTYEVYDLGERWTKTLGKPEKGFTMNISGDSSNGKTDFTVKLCKAFGQIGVRVDYNSYEEGHGSTLQEAIKRNNMQEVSGKVMFLNRLDYKALVARLSKRNSAQIVVIDSADDMGFTYKQFRELHQRFPRKGLIIVTWGKKVDGTPLLARCRDIRFKCEIKTLVRDFVAYPGSRYGGNENFIIRERETQPGEQLNLIK